MFFHMGQLGPHPHFCSLGIKMMRGVFASWVCGSTFTGGLEVDVGGIGQSFLHSNRFPDIDPALDHGVPAWVGIFSSGEGLLSHVFSWEEFSFSEFIVVLGTIADDCVAVLLTLEVDLGLATTHTLYLFCGDEFSLFASCFCFLLTRGLVLGWVGLD